MTVENWRGHVVTCAVFAFFCAGLSYTAYQVNSWGKWQKSSSEYVYWLNYFKLQVFEMLLIHAASFCCEVITQLFDRLF